MMADTQTGTGRRPRGPILVSLVAALAALVAVLLALAALTIDGIARSGIEILRAEQSLEQLENIRAVEAAFERYLLGEIDRRVNADPERRESEAAGALRGALLVHRRAIGEEIAAAVTEAERDAERAEMVRANALAEIFETIETESIFERFAGPPADPAAAAAGFLATRAGERAEVFRAVVFEVLADERHEAAEAFAALDRLRARYLATGGALAAAFALAAAGFGVVFYRGLLRPIRQLGLAAERLPAPAARAPEDLPAEFAVLARRFNAMAARIGSEHERLQTVVATRTAELEAANAALTRIDRSRRRFFADVSHELRTPVTVLLGEAQIALRRPGEERAALERIAANGRFLSRRLDDLMRLARSEDGQLALARRPVDLGQAVAEAVEAARAYAAANEIALELLPGPPVPLEGDPEALRQAALALIDNAVKFSPEGGRVEVAMAPRGFSVADTGPGFASTEPERLLARYAQERSGAAHGGSGLGLAIVKWIADRHGARIRAENRPEGGARISLEFPA